MRKEEDALTQKYISDKTLSQLYWLEGHYSKPKKPSNWKKMTAAQKNAARDKATTFYGITNSSLKALKNSNKVPESIKKMDIFDMSLEDAERATAWYAVLNYDQMIKDSGADPAQNPFTVDELGAILSLIHNTGTRDLRLNYKKNKENPNSFYNALKSGDKYKAIDNLLKDFDGKYMDYDRRGFVHRLGATVNIFFNPNAPYDSASGRDDMYKTMDKDKNHLEHLGQAINRTREHESNRADNTQQYYQNKGFVEKPENKEKTPEQKVEPKNKEQKNDRSFFSGLSNAFSNISNLFKEIDNNPSNSLNNVEGKTNGN